VKAKDVVQDAEGDSWKEKKNGRVVFESIFLQYVEIKA
jgi:hypothetical protein